MAPVEHINGKMAPQALKCGNTYTPDSEPEVLFYYGYKHKASPNVSRFGIRSVRRDLNTKPYTPEEDENRTLFRASLLAVYEHKRIRGDWGLMLTDFKRQKQYATALGYAIAAVRGNGGVWLDNWTS